MEIKSFKELEKIAPQALILEGNYTCDFWEQLYQIFKARLIQEQTKQEVEG